MSKHPFTVKKLLSKLKEYGIIPMTKGGKGSEIILLKPIEPGSKKGPQYPIKDHGEGTEISVPVVRAILRRFSIDESKFWDN